MEGLLTVHVRLSPHATWGTCLEDIATARNHAHHWEAEQAKVLVRTVILAGVSLLPATCKVLFCPYTIFQTLCSTNPWQIIWKEKGMKKPAVGYGEFL